MFWTCKADANKACSKHSKWLVDHPVTTMLSTTWKIRGKLKKDRKRLRLTTLMMSWIEGQRWNLLILWRDSLWGSASLRSRKLHNFLQEMMISQWSAKTLKVMKKKISPVSITMQTKPTRKSSALTPTLFWSKSMITLKLLRVQFKPWCQTNSPCPNLLTSLLSWTKNSLRLLEKWKTSKFTLSLTTSQQSSLDILQPGKATSFAVSTRFRTGSVCSRTQIQATSGSFQRITCSLWGQLIASRLHLPISRLLEHLQQISSTKIKLTTCWQIFTRMQ